MGPKSVWEVQLPTRSRRHKKAARLGGSPVFCKLPTPKRNMATILMIGRLHNHRRRISIPRPRAGITMLLESKAPAAMLPSLFLAGPQRTQIQRSAPNLQVHLSRLRLTFLPASSLFFCVGNGSLNKSRRRENCCYDLATFFQTPFSSFQL